MEKEDFIANAQVYAVDGVTVELVDGVITRTAGDGVTEFPDDALASVSANDIRLFVEEGLVNGVVPGFDPLAGVP